MSIIIITAIALVFLLLCLFLFLSICSSRNRKKDETNANANAQRKADEQKNADEHNLLQDVYNFDPVDASPEESMIYFSKAPRSLFSMLPSISDVFSSFRKPSKDYGDTAEDCRPSDTRRPLPSLNNTRDIIFAIASYEVLEPGKYTPVDVYAYIAEHEKKVRDAITKEFGQLAQTTTSGPYALRDRVKLRIVLECSHASIEDSCQTFLWTGGVFHARFQILVPKDCTETQILLKCRVYASHVLICTLSTALDVQEENRRPMVETKHIQKAFVSYASKDREAVLYILQGIQHTAPWMQIFLDVVSLGPGEWEAQLYKHIDLSDIFYLFWSQHAKESPNVDREWRYALDRKGLDFIEPVPLELPYKVPPPLELSKKHFNSWTLHVHASNQL